MLIDQLFKDKHSALLREIEPELAQWDTNSYLLALVHDDLNAANWQRSGKGPAPKPLDRPKSRFAIEAEAEATQIDATAIGADERELAAIVADRQARHLARLRELAAED